MLNKMIIHGRLTADPELNTKGDVKYCNFRVAWSKKYKEKEKKLFLSCVTFGYTAEFVSKYFQKGQQILLEGELITNSYEKDGETKSSINMEVKEVHFCGDKKDSNNSGDNSLDEVTPLDKLPW
jgi:single-strand DNA-binding protein